MPRYGWRDVETGELVDVQRPMAESHVPPDDERNWVRDYSGLMIGRVEGAGGSLSKVVKSK